MSDTLVITFQTRLSAVMETVLKTTMFEVTRLVEESFLEQMERGKRESEMLRRRLLSSEAKLRERERFKKVRCMDCSRSALSRRRIPLRGSETPSSLDNPHVVKEENLSANSWRCNTKRNTNQEKPTGCLETNSNSVCEATSSEVKEEAKEPRETQTCLITHKQKDSQSNVEETNGAHSSSDSQHKPGGASCPERPRGEEVVRQKSPSKWFVSNKAAVPQPDPSQNLVSTQIGSRDSNPIKQEVVVVLPADWEEMERIKLDNRGKKMQLNQQRVQNRTVFPASSIKVHTVPQTAVRKNTKLVLHPSAVVTNQGATNAPQSLASQKLSQTRALPEAACERSLSAVQPARGVAQMLNVRVQGQHSGRMLHSCSQCGKGFSHLCHLRAHQQIHSGDRQFCCSLCGRSFTKLSNLKAHRRVHTGERPYICSDCGKRFTQKCNLKRHQRIHSEVTHSGV